MNPRLIILLETFHRQTERCLPQEDHYVGKFWFRQHFPMLVSLTLAESLRTKPDSTFMLRKFKIVDTNQDFGIRLSWTRQIQHFQTKRRCGTSFILTEISLSLDQKWSTWNTRYHLPIILRLHLLGTPSNLSMHNYPVEIRIPCGRLVGRHRLRLKKVTRLLMPCRKTRLSIPSQIWSRLQLPKEFYTQLSRAKLWIHQAPAYQRPFNKVCSNFFII